MQTIIKCTMPGMLTTCTARRRCGVHLEVARFFWEWNSHTADLTGCDSKRPVKGRKMRMKETRQKKSYDIRKQLAANNRRKNWTVDVLCCSDQNLWGKLCFCQMRWRWWWRTTEKSNFFLRCSFGERWCKKLWISLNVLIPSLHSPRRHRLVVWK